MNKDLTEEDLEHIERLQALRSSGMVNMFTELKQGLDAVLEPEQAEETYDWVTDNFDYYMNGEWVEVEL